MSTGTAFMNRVLLALSAAGATVFRNNTGSGWAGKSFSLSPGQVYRARGGERVVQDARPLKAGLCTGSSDIIGLVPVTVTPAMVGSRLAVFVAVECKDGKGRATDDQAKFIAHVLAAGGAAAVAHSEAEALAALAAARQ